MSIRHMKKETPGSYHFSFFYWKLCFMLDSIYLLWDVQIAVFEYGFNDKKSETNTKRREFYHDLSSNR